MFFICREEQIQQLNEQLNIDEQDIEMLKEQVSTYHLYCTQSLVQLYTGSSQLFDIFCFRPEYEKQSMKKIC